MYIHHEICVNVSRRKTEEGLNFLEIWHHD